MTGIRSIVMVMLAGWLGVAANVRADPLDKAPPLYPKQAWAHVSYGVVPSHR